METCSYDYIPYFYKKKIKACIGTKLFNERDTINYSADLITQSEIQNKFH